MKTIHPKHSHISSEFFFALSDPNRVKITEMLATRGTMSAGDISAQFKVSPPAISQHLKVLREAQIILMKKKAQQRLYQINFESFHEPEAWMQNLKKSWKKRFSQLDALLSN